MLPVLSDNSYHHFILASDNILAASVVVTSAVRSSLKPEKIVFHVITDKKTYAGMHSWFALNPLSPAIVEVKSVHQFGWLTRENVPILGAIESHHAVRNHYHGNHVLEVNTSDNPHVFSAKLQARSPKYISILNHLRMYLPEVNLCCSLSFYIWCSYCSGTSVLVCILTIRIHLVNRNGEYGDNCRNMDRLFNLSIGKFRHELPDH